jgi:hypothetical protein
MAQPFAERIPAGTPLDFGGLAPLAPVLGGEGLGAYK